MKLKDILDRIDELENVENEACEKVLSVEDKSNGFSFSSLIGKILLVTLLIVILVVIAVVAGCTIGVASIIAGAIVFVGYLAFTAIDYFFLTPPEYRNGKLIENIIVLVAIPFIALSIPSVTSAISLYGTSTTAAIYTPGGQFVGAFLPRFINQPFLFLKQSGALFSLKNLALYSVNITLNAFLGLFYFEVGKNIGTNDASELATDVFIRSNTLTRVINMFFNLDEKLGDEDIVCEK